MPATHLEQVTELREVSVDRVEEPEAGDVRDAEFGQALVLLPAAAGQRGAFRGKDFDQPASYRDEILAGRDVHDGRDEPGIELGTHRWVTGAPGPPAYWSCPPGTRLRSEAAGSSGRPGSASPRARCSRRAAGAPRPYSGCCGPSNRPTRCIRRGGTREWPGRCPGSAGRAPSNRRAAGAGRAVGGREIEQQPVGKDARRGGEGEGAAGQRLAVDLEPGEAPRIRGEAGELKLEDVLEEPILGLKVLRAEEHALGPKHRLQLAHRWIT